MDSRIADVFARQLGLITTEQARALGVTRDAVLHRVARGEWERVRNGLFRLRGTPPSWEQRVLGATLSAGHHAWASHFTALRLWGYRGFDDKRTEVTVPLERRPRIEGAEIIRTVHTARARGGLPGHGRG